MAHDDFDFFHGEWHVHNRRLTTLLAGADDWIEFPAECRTRELADGIGFVDEMTFPTLGSTGSTIGLYETGEDRWACYWVSSRDGQLQPPVYGHRKGNTSVFYGEDEMDSKPIKVRYEWTVESADAFDWVQAFSADGGNSWEANWIMRFTRA